MQAVATALTCLCRLGIEIPAHPTQEEVQAEYEAVWQTLDGRPIEGLIDLPLMIDPELQACHAGALDPYSPAYFTDFHLFCLHLCRMVNISLQHGTSGDSAPGYGYFGTDARTGLSPLRRWVSFRQARMRSGGKARLRRKPGESLRIDGTGCGLDAADRDCDRFQ